MTILNTNKFGCMTSLTHAGGRGEPVEVPRAHSTEGRYDMIAPRGEGRRRHLAASLTLSSLSNVILLLLLCMALSTAAPITASGTGLGRGHWISRSHRDAASAGDQQWEPNDWSRSIDGAACARMERQAQQELREMFGDEFCQQLEEEAAIIDSVHEQKARVGREADCTPTSPLASPRLPLGSLLLPQGSRAEQNDGREDARGESTRASGGSGCDIAGPMADWLR